MPSTFTDTQSAAKLLACSFELAERTNGDEFFKLTAGSPEWMTNVVYAAHGAFAPDDWRYECIYRAAQTIAEEGEDTDSGEFADGQVDVYTARRTAWLASNLNRVGYCDDAVRELGWEEPPDGGINTLIGWGQYMEASEVFALVLQALEEVAASREP